MAIAIIGSGISGLAVAIRLSRAGKRVFVYESGATYGGKMGVFEKDGYRFDMGPSLFTLPDQLSDLLDDDLKIETIRLKTLNRNFFSDGKVFDAPADSVAFAEEASKAFEIDKRILRDYLKEAKALWELTAPVFIYRSLHRLKDLMKWSNYHYLYRWTQLRPFTSLHRYNQRRFGNSGLVMLFDRYATYNGSNPYLTPATLRVISHLENNLGAYLPVRGMRSIVDALYQQAIRLGVEVIFNARVSNIVRVGERWELTFNDSIQGYEKVINTIDVRTFYREIFKNKSLLLKESKKELSTSALIFYWGIARRIEKLDVHNVFYSSNYHEEFKELKRGTKLFDDPTVYVYNSSVVIKEDAPENCSNLFIMINAPTDRGQDWVSWVNQIRPMILRKLEKALGEELEKWIVLEKVLTPRMIETGTGSFGGALYGSASNRIDSAFKRHPNFLKGYPGLYFAGGSVHPGGGVPLCLASAKIVEMLINEDEKNNG